MKLCQYLIESNRLKVYFAHPRATYGKPEETKCIKMITDKFPEHIIVTPNNSNIIDRANKMGFDIFFGIINTTQIMCVMPFKDGIIGNGAYRECEHASKKGIPIFVVNPWNNTITVTPFHKLKGISPEETFGRIDKKDQHKWKVHETSV